LVKASGLKRNRPWCPCPNGCSQENVAKLLSIEMHVVDLRVGSGEKLKRLSSTVGIYGLRDGKCGIEPGQIVVTSIVGQPHRVDLVVCRFQAT